MNNFWKTLLGSFVGCLLALFILGLIGIGILGSIISVAEKSEPVIPKTAILKIDFKQPITEQSGEKINFDITSMSASFDSNISLLKAIQAIDMASKDPGIKFIYMNPETLNMGIAQAEEFRAALKRFRESGKAIISYSTNFNNANYYIASVADKVFIDAYGDAFITGIGTNMMFFKDLLDKLGIEMQLIRHGKYKAAAEQFIKNDISAENREQNQVMLNTIWGAWSQDIAESRGFSVEDFNSWIDNLEIQNIQSLLERNMIDQACYHEEVGNYLCDLFGVEKAKDLKFVTLDQYAKVKVKPNFRAADKIAVVYATGEIVIDGTEEQISGIKLAQQLEKVRQDSTIKAVVLRVDSPGGNAQAAEMINYQLGLLKEVKPVIASYGNYAASGGYWISARADKIFTDNTTLTGSIGVFSLVPNIGGALKKTLSINTIAITSNKHGDALSGMRKLDDAEMAFMQKNVEKVYTDFTALVSEGRSMSVEKVDEIGQGRVWAGRDALQIGLADTKGGLIDALQYASALIGKEDYQLVEFPVQKSTYEKMMESISNVPMAAEALSNPLSLIEKAYAGLKGETKVTTYARLPYIYDFR